MYSWRLSDMASHTLEMNFDIAAFETRNICWRDLKLFPVAKKDNVISNFNFADKESLNWVLFLEILGLTNFNKDWKFSGVNLSKDMYSFVSSTASSDSNKADAPWVFLLWIHSLTQTCFFLFLFFLPGPHQPLLTMCHTLFLYIF